MNIAHSNHTFDGIDDVKAIEHGELDTVLRVENLAVAYKMRNGDFEAVQNVSFNINRGESFGLVGESGCGKSTLAWAIVNFLGRSGYVKRGGIEFLGQDLLRTEGERLRQLRGDRISMVYQDPSQALNPSMRIGDQMKEVVTYHRRASDEVAERTCIDMLERVHMSDAQETMTRYPHQLSGGQQQRVVIGMALLNKPALLIMDEPTTSLDVTVEAAVLDLIDDLRRDSETAILYITHNLGVVARVCSRMAVMYSGEIVESGPVDQVFDEPMHPYTYGLFRSLPLLGTSKAAGNLNPIPGRVPSPSQRPPGCVFAPRCAFRQRRCEDEAPVLRQVPGGREVRCHLAEEIGPLVGNPSDASSHGAFAPRPLPADTLLSLDHLQKYYSYTGNSLTDVVGFGKRRHIKAVDGVSFTLARGSTLGIVGESGCGKSTLAKTIIGLEESTGGTTEFMGFDISGKLSDRDTELIRELQMVFQHPDATMNPSYTVGQQISRPLHRFHVVPKSQVRDEVIRLLDAVQLDVSYCGRYPRQLSGGEKQRVGIARALACRPDLILCDEPLSALDVSVQAAILNLLVEVQSTRGTAILLIAHDLSVVRYISDYVAVMYLGKFVEYGPVDAIYRPPYHPYTEALLSAVPVPDPSAKRTQIRLEGTVPSAIDQPAGCRFHTRCPRRQMLPDGGIICQTEAPPWRYIGEQGHRIRCHLPLEFLLDSVQFSWQETVESDQSGSARVSS